jgi:hypothetical protein
MKNAVKSNRMDIRYFQGYKFVCPDKLYPKEACDVRTQYSSIFSFSSNKNCQSDDQSASCGNSYPSPARQAISTSLSRMRQEGFRYSQLDPAQDSRFEPFQRPNVDHLSVSQSVLCTLPWNSYRGVGAISSLPSGNSPHGTIYLSTVPVYDRFGGGFSFGPGLENGQSRRQILSGARLRSSRSKWASHSGRGRDRNQKGASLFDRSAGLSERPHSFCRKRSQGQNVKTVFQHVER